MRALPRTWGLSLLSRRFFAVRELQLSAAPLQNRTIWRNRTEVLERIDDHIRSHFPKDPGEVVEEVVRVRNGIWAGLRGRKSGSLSSTSWTDRLSKQKVDKRQRNDDEQAVKRQRIDNGDESVLPIYATKFSEEDLKAEERRPKKKVAVLIGYAGTGYHGMQL